MSIGSESDYGRNARVFTNHEKLRRKGSLDRKQAQLCKGRLISLVSKGLREKVIGSNSDKAERTASASQIILDAIFLWRYD